MLTLFSDIAHSPTTNSPSSWRTSLHCCANSIYTTQTPWRYFCSCTVQSIDSALFFSRDTHTLTGICVHMAQSLIYMKHTPLQLCTICSPGALSLLTVGALPRDNILLHSPPPPPVQFHLANMQINSVNWLKGRLNPGKAIKCSQILCKCQEEGHLGMYSCNAHFSSCMAIFATRFWPKAPDHEPTHPAQWGHTPPRQGHKPITTNTGHTFTTNTT